MRNAILAALLFSLGIVGCSKKDGSSSDMSGTWKLLNPTVLYESHPDKKEKGGQQTDSISEIGSELTVLGEKSGWVKVKSSQFEQGFGWIQKHDLFDEGTMRVLRCDWLTAMADTFQLKPGAVQVNTPGDTSILFWGNDSTIVVKDSGFGNYASSFEEAVKSARFLDDLRNVGVNSVAKPQPATVKINCRAYYNDFKETHSFPFGTEGTWSGDVFNRKYTQSAYQNGRSYTCIRVSKYCWFKPKGGRGGYVAESIVIPNSYLAYDSTNRDDLAFVGIVSNEDGDSADFYRPRIGSVRVAKSVLSTEQVDILSRFCLNFAYSDEYYDEDKRRFYQLNEFLTLLEEKNHPMLGRIKTILQDMNSPEKLSAIAGKLAGNEKIAAVGFWYDEGWGIRTLIRNEFPVRGVSIPNLLNILWAVGESHDDAYCPSEPFWRFPDEFWEYLEKHLLPVDDSGNGLAEYEEFFKNSRGVMRELFYSYNTLFDNMTDEDVRYVLNKFDEWVIKKGVRTYTFQHALGEAEIRSMNRYPDFITNNLEEYNPVFYIYLGFLFRRSYDSSHYYIWKMLTQILWAYDREWYLEHATPFGKPESSYNVRNYYDNSGCLNCEDDGAYNQFERSYNYGDDFFRRRAYYRRNRNRDDALKLLDTLQSKKYLLAYSEDGKQFRIPENAPVIRIAKRAGLADSIFIESAVDSNTYSDVRFRHSENGDTIIVQAEGINNVKRHKVQNRFYLYKNRYKENALYIKGGFRELGFLEGMKRGFCLIPEEEKSVYLASGIAVEEIAEEDSNDEDVQVNTDIMP